MPVPEFNQVGIIPPFLGVDPAESVGQITPFRVELIEVVDKLGNSSHRRLLLRNLITYREELRATGVAVVCQWLAGSFVENIDVMRSPKDIDVVNFFSLAGTSTITPDQYRLFDHDEIKDRYKLDSYFVPIDDFPFLLEKTCYWLGLFGHRRRTFEWKGIVEVPFTDDSAASARLGVLDAE